MIRRGGSVQTGDSKEERIQEGRGGLTFEHVVHVPKAHEWQLHPSFVQPRDGIPQVIVSMVPRPAPPGIIQQAGGPGCLPVILACFCLAA